MAGYTKFQTNIATGRATFPVAILICLLLWGISIDSWSSLISFVSYALTGYLLIEMNTAFTLIRTRTTLHICTYWFLTAACLFLHPFQPVNFVPLFFIVTLFQLFRSYETQQATKNIFHAFFFTAAGSLLFPQLLYFVPLYYIGMASFRSLSAKTFFASLIGMVTPYWFLFCYAFYFDKMELFSNPLLSLVRFHPIDYQSLAGGKFVSYGIITLISLVCSVHYFFVSYLDKTRTRLFFSFLIGAEVWIYLIGFLQPRHVDALFQLQILIGSILAGHLFTLTRNRFSGIFFIVTFVILIILAIYNLWMQLFNS